MAVRALLLDVTGTLATFSEPMGASYRRAALRAGMRPDIVPTEVELLVGFKAAFRRQSRLLPCYGALHGASEEMWWKATARDTLLSCMPLSPPEEQVQHFLRLVYAHYADAGAYLVYPDAPVLLRDAKSHGLVVGVLTNSSQRTIDLLPALGLAPYVDVAASCQEIGHAKPKPEAFVFSLAQLRRLVPDLRADQVLHIGDHALEDLDGARRAGLQALHLERGAGASDGSIASLAQVMPLLRARGAV